MYTQKNDPNGEIVFSKGIVGFAAITLIKMHAAADKSLNKYQERLKKLKSSAPNKI